MEIINIKKLVSIAKKFHSQRKKWHFHMLTPNCIFNKKDKHAFMLENIEYKEIFIVYSDKRYMKEGKELVKLLYGESIIEEKRLKSKITNKRVLRILKKERRLNKLGIEWHHHLLFPECIFNKHKGKWCILFENPENNEMIESISKSEPIKNLRAIETLYYQQKR
ncbi:hypothetical protein J4448_04785 [Candidatus Woesearchaeota archaeon]|nr:hypothetical protein [Candidatus Woesearchaeota archaeon]